MSEYPPRKFLFEVWRTRLKDECVWKMKAPDPAAAATRAAREFIEDSGLHESGYQVEEFTVRASETGELFQVEVVVALETVFRVIRCRECEQGEVVL